MTHRGPISIFFVLAAGSLLSWPAPVRSQDAGPHSDALDWRQTMNQRGNRPVTDPSPTDAKSPEPPTTGTDLGGRLLEMLLVLAGVCALAYAVLRWGVRGVVGADRDTDGPIRVLARRRIGSDRSILVVRVGPRALVIGESDAGITRLDTLDGDDLDDFLTQLDSDDDSTTNTTFSSLWRLGTEYSEDDVDE